MINLSNDAEFKVLFDRYYVPLCLFADRYLENEEMAADIVQESFLKLWQLRKDFFYLHQARSFLYTTVRNKSLNELDHRKVVSEYTLQTLQKSKESFFTDHLIESETYRVLSEAIDQLPPQTRAVMRLALDGFSNAEIAQELTISGETVHSLKKIAYRKLRVVLKEYYFLLLLI
ncbi:MAG: RNA polymerase sigma-70 factor [Bacteroidales bacterium]